MVEVIWSAAARSELVDAQDWYEAELPGLGRRFRLGIQNAVERISANPLQFPVVFKTVRRAPLRRFPYLVVFSLDASAAFVIACFHASRDPRRWYRRT